MNRTPPAWSPRLPLRAPWAAVWRVARRARGTPRARAATRGQYDERKPREVQRRNGEGGGAPPGRIIVFPGGRGKSARPGPWGSGVRVGTPSRDSESGLRVGTPSRDSESGLRVVDLTPEYPITPPTT